jgi:hypothetical protein
MRAEPKRRGGTTKRQQPPEGATQLRARLHASDVASRDTWNGHVGTPPESRADPESVVVESADDRTRPGGARLRRVVPIVMLLIPMACSNVSATPPSPATPAATTATTATTAADAFCSTLQRFTQEASGEIQSAENSKRFIDTVERQAERTVEVLRGQEQDMDAATRRRADEVIGAIRELATWDPGDLPTTYRDVIAKADSAITGFLVADCTPGT